MSKSDAFEQQWLDLIFTNANIANLGDATGVRGSTVAGQLFVALHTADPGEAGSAQTTSEVAYTGYARVGINRVSGAGGWTRTGSSVSPTTNPVAFAACTGGTATATHFSVGVVGSGAGQILYKGALSPTISISTGVTPQAGITISED